MMACSGVGTLSGGTARYQVGFEGSEFALSPGEVG